MRQTDGSSGKAAEHMEDTARICRQCLLRDLPDADRYANFYAYLKALPGEERVSDEVYENRLKLCLHCDRLLSGMCILCGCYVELRAAMRIRGCPKLPPRWRPDE